MILNLAKPENSEIKFEPYKFPDGQQQIKIVSDVSQYGNVDITIKSRLNNFLDLELIVCAVKSIRGLFFGTKGIRLEVPYFLGSRSDRKFEDGSNNYLKDVICPIINSLNLEAVCVLDAHSDVLEACLNNYIGTNNHELVRWALQREPFNSDNTLLMSPDAGALKKIYKVAEAVNYTLDIVTCSKSRGTDGRLTKTEVPHFDITKNVVIIDDICDGGATFINIAKEIKLRHESYDREKSHVPLGKIYLIVTHGIFSKGFLELDRYFDGIFCTNSYSDKENWDLEFGNPSYAREARFVNNGIKQLKVI